MTPSEFRQRYPEFEEVGEQLIQTYLDLADDLLGRAWQGSWRDLGLGLFTAHHLELNGSVGGAEGSGGTSGPVQSETVDTVSVTYDTTVSSQEGAGFWNGTKYGREFAYWLRIVGLMQGPRQYLPPGAHG